MAFTASLIGAGSVWIGLEGSLKWDTPAGPSIVVAALVAFIASVLPVRWLMRQFKPTQIN
jgi:zinc transport system permease protein